MGLTRPITASTGACAACNKPYQEVGGSPPASAFSFSDVDVGDAFQFINNIIAERRRYTIRLNLKPEIGGSPLPSNVRASPEFVFFTRRRRRRVSIYQSYIGEPLLTCSFLSPLRDNMIYKMKGVASFNHQRETDSFMVCCISPSFKLIRESLSLEQAGI